MIGQKLNLLNILSFIMTRLRTAYTLILIVGILYGTSIASIAVLYSSPDQPVDCIKRSIFFTPDYITWLIAYSTIVLILALLLTYFLYHLLETVIIWIFIVILICIVCYVVCGTLGIVIVFHEISNCIQQGDTISTMIAVDVFSFISVIGLLYASSTE